MADRQLGKWTFGLVWILLNVLGWALFLGFGMAAGWLVWTLYEQGGYPRLLHNEVIRDFLTLFIVGFCWGALLGWLQQIVLKRRFGLEGSAWAWATMIGGVLSVVIPGLSSILLLVLPYSRASYYVLSVLVASIPPMALGLAQWVVLRRYFARAGWWVAAVVVALWIVPVLFSTFSSGHITLVYMIILRGSEGVAYGLATFAVLSVLPRQTPAGEGA
jgi:hypothetical protein